MKLNKEGKGANNRLKGKKEERENKEWKNWKAKRKNKSVYKGDKTTNKKERKK